MYIIFSFKKKTSQTLAGHCLNDGCISEAEQKTLSVYDYKMLTKSNSVVIPVVVYIQPAEVANS